MATKGKTPRDATRSAVLIEAGNYFVYGRPGGESRERIQGWALQLKGEVLQKMALLRRLDQQTYDALIDRTAHRYARLKRIRAYEVKRITIELKSAWTHISMTLL